MPRGSDAMKTPARSWVESANDAASGFPLTSLPWCVFLAGDERHIGVGIGDSILDVKACADRGLLHGLDERLLDACRAQQLNPLMTLGSAAWDRLRRCMTELLAEPINEAAEAKARDVEALLVKQRAAVFTMPAAIGDYTDFYASAHHARRVGSLFRPENPLLPNYKWVPIGYHGRASSIVLSGTAVRRPRGQRRGEDGRPIFVATTALDYEAEIGFLVGPGNAQGTTIPIAEAERHIFGLCVVNDWSARDVQSWEYQPLGPFLAKSFATSISPWIVPLEALAPYRVPGPERDDSDPQTLDYLQSTTTAMDGIDVSITVALSSERMRAAGMEAMTVSRGNLRSLFWTLRQMVTHHASNGCNLRSGDLMATGTISGAAAGSEGCLLEMRATRGALKLPTGEQREFLEDGDAVTISASAEREGLPRVEMGSCTSVVLPAL